jgi:hypothetical protein
MSIFLSNPLVSRRIVRHGSCQLRADSSAADEGFPNAFKQRNQSSRSANRLCLRSATTTLIGEAKGTANEIPYRLAR